jgi:hypothetical protein
MSLFVFHVTAGRDAGIAAEVPVNHISAGFLSVLPDFDGFHEIHHV